MKGRCQGVGIGALKLQDSNLYFRGENVRASRHRCVHVALQTQNSELSQIGEGEKKPQQINKHTLQAEE